MDQGSGNETQSEDEVDDDDGQDTGGATADSDNTVVERDLNEDENGGVDDETEDGEVRYFANADSTEYAKIVFLDWITFAFWIELACAFWIEPHPFKSSQGGCGSSEDNLSHESYELIEKVVPVSGTPQPAVTQV